MASDGVGGSGIASSTCADIVGPATGFGVGSHTFSATATDNVGLTGAASTTIDVTVTPTSLGDLTIDLVHESARYQALPPRQQASLDRTIEATLTSLLRPLNYNIAPPVKRLLILGYKLTVSSYAATGLLTRAQAAQLSGYTTSL